MLAWLRRPPAFGRERSRRDMRSARLERALLAVSAAVVHTSTGDLLELICRELQAACGAQYVCVHLDHPDVVGQRVAERGYTRCPVATQPASEQARFMAAEASQGWRARARGHGAAADGLLDSPDFRALAERAGFAGGFAIPLAYQGETFGTINVYTLEPRPAIDPGLCASVGAVLYGTIKRQAFVTVLERVRGTLERYLPPELVQKIVSEPETLVTPTRLDRVTVLFSDIRGFTALAEQVPPEQLAELLSEHLSAMAEAVFSQGGMVDKYLGDAVMAVFGAPFPLADHASRALAAALEMQARQCEVSVRWAPRVGRPIQIGIGIHTGPVAVREVGHARRAEYATVGDTVNVASRLRDLAGPGQILVGQPTVVAAGDGFVLRPASSLALRGHAAPVAVYVLEA